VSSSSVGFYRTAEDLDASLRSKSTGCRVGQGR
jgi:hypothetical protein